MTAKRNFNAKTRSVDKSVPSATSSSGNKTPEAHHLTRQATHAWLFLTINEYNKVAKKVSICYNKFVPLTVNFLILVLK